MNTALLEELVRRKAEYLHGIGIPVSEAIERAGEEILNGMSAAGGYGSRFCLRMCLGGAKKRISPDRLGSSSGPEGDKWCWLSCPWLKGETGIH